MARCASRLDMRSWEAAHKPIRDWEIQGKKPVTVNEAAMKAPKCRRRSTDASLNSQSRLVQFNELNQRRIWRTA